MGKLKEIKFIYECKICGTDIMIVKVIQIDEYLKKIEIPKPINKCVCGENKFKLIDINIIFVDLEKEK